MQFARKMPPALPKEEGWAHEIMGRLLEKVGMDLFHCRGKDFLTMVDYLTDFRVVGDSLSGSPSMQTTICIPVWVHTDGRLTVHGLGICTIFQELGVSTYPVVPIQQPVKWQG